MAIKKKAPAKRPATKKAPAKKPATKAPAKKPATKKAPAKSKAVVKRKPKGGFPPLLALLPAIAAAAAAASGIAGTAAGISGAVKNSVDAGATRAKEIREQRAEAIKMRNLQVARARAANKPRGGAAGAKRLPVSRSTLRQNAKFAKDTAMKGAEYGMKGIAAARQVKDVVDKLKKVTLAIKQARGGTPFNGNMGVARQRGITINPYQQRSLTRQLKKVGPRR